MVEQENRALATTCAPRSQRTEQLSKSQLIREWILKLALNAGQALDADAIGIYTALWSEGFDDLPNPVLETAFRKTLRESKYWPLKVCDIRGHFEHASETATREAAEIAWQRVLDLRRVVWNPDIPTSLERALTGLSERVRQAARAAGVFRDFTAAEFESGALHTWAKKRFVESFIAYGELEQDQFLLPDGDLKNLIAGIAETKMLSATSDDWSECRARGEAYREQLATHGVPDLSPEERLRIADELAATARKVLNQPREHVVTVSDERRKALQYQAEFIKSRYPTSDTPEGLRHYILEPAPPIAQSTEDATP